MSGPIMILCGVIGFSWALFCYNAWLFLATANQYYRNWLAAWTSLIVASVVVIVVAS